ncbi:hypothetical protein DEO72_LG1g2728 [Vigna unguiculata]|uniref:Uncharacterized protein n=1 Tax=Vigna unguiculata TaxID=3917 RepID=A0A4D6KQZ4_VIGUN|nr:hypothetical protein DEO72_LG1g2728 [Vigna unguiculata]
MGVHEELNESAKTLYLNQIILPERTSPKTLLPPTSSSTSSYTNQAVGDTAHGGTTHDGTNSHLRHHNIMCVHQSRSKHNHARGKAANGDDNHSRRFVNIATARHCTTYSRAKHYRTVSSARVFFGPPRPLPRLPFRQRDRCQLLMPLTSPSSLSVSRSLFNPSPLSI